MASFILSLPLFYQFASHQNYYKLLYDFNIYDCVTEEYAPQQAVTNTYPTMVEGQVQPGDVTEGGFDSEYFRGTIDKQMAFMEEYGRTLDGDLDRLADNMEAGEIKVKLSDRLDPRKVTAEDVQDLVQRAAYEFDEGTYIPVRVATPPILIEVIKRHSKGEYIPMDLPMIMEVGKVRQATEEDDGIEYENNRPHGISLEGMVEIFKGMGDPAYIVFQKNGRYAEIIRYRDKTGKTALASVDFYGLGDRVKYKYAQYMNGYEGGLYNVVVTTYNPDDLQSYLDDPENLIIYDKKKGLPEVGSGSKLPSHLTDKPFYEDIITKPTDVVKKNSDRDSTYLDAVNRGDMETAQRMVDEKLASAGFTTKGYHGTRTPGFTTVDGALWLARDKCVASGYGLYEADRSVRKAPHDENGVYSLLYRLGNNLHIDAKGNSWADLPVSEADYPGVFVDEEDGDSISTDAIAEWASEHGYDSVTFLNVDDGGLTTVDVIFHPQRDAKSADPVTYDDNGNVIPLSERGNPERTDIRYSDRYGVMYHDRYELSASEYNRLIQKKPVKVSRQVLALIRAQRKTRYSSLDEKDIPIIDFFRIGDYRIINNGFTYYIRNSGADTFSVVMRRKIRPDMRHETKEVISDERRNGNETTSSGVAQKRGERGPNRGDSGSSRNGGKLPANAGGSVSTRESQRDLPAGQSNADSGALKVSDRSGKSVSNRSLLVDAFEELIKSPKERELIEEYRANIAKVDDVQERLRKIRAKIRELSKKGEKAQLRELRKTAKELAELIDKYDRKLLELESSKPLRDVLERAKREAYREGKRSAEVSLREYRKEVTKQNRSHPTGWLLSFAGSVMLSFTAG